MSQGGPKPSSFYIERQALSRLPATPAAPSGLDSAHAFGQNDPGIGNPQAGDGLLTAGLMAVVVSIYPNPGQTLSGAGNLLCWVYNPYQAQWTRCAELDLSLTNSSGFPARTWGATASLGIRFPARLGFLINFLASGVTVSGGDVLVRLDGFQSVLGMTS